MKVLISVVGRFHAFDLAKELKRHKVLYKLNTSMPKFKAREWGISNDEIKSNIFWEIMRRYFSKWFSSAFLERNSFISQSKSNYILLEKSDIFIGWSGSSLEAMKKAKAIGKICILERGSSHYSYQMQILTEEYSLYGKSFTPSEWLWKRELQEYEVADYISIPSTFVKNTFIKHGIPEEKLFINPYGVDLSNFKRVEKSDSVFRIITSGNLSIRKGSKYLLEAFSELGLENSEIWHIGSINEDMLAWLENYDNNKVKFLGHKPQNELYQYYSQGSLFCLMSLEEGLAMVQPQAMACGLPLIITTNTGGSDLISEQGKEGFVIDIRDKEMLKKHLMYLYNNPEILSNMSEASIKRVKSGFTWEDYGNRYVDFLQNKCMNND